MSKSATKDLCIIHFTEGMNRQLFRKRFVNACREGIFAFKVTLRFGVGKDARTFDSKIGIYEDADMDAIIYCADTYFDRYSDIVAKLVLNRNAQVADKIA